jgi:hypothetical protein
MTSRFPQLLVASAVAVVIMSVSACSTSPTTSEDTLTGVISEVSGDLTTLTAFVVLAEDGSSHRFTPVDGLLFEGGPLTHLREHVVTGQPIVVTFERGSGGELTAIRIEDA